MSLVVKYVYDITSWMLYTVAHVVLRDLTNYYWHQELAELELQNDLSSKVQNVSALDAESSKTSPTSYENVIQECEIDTENLALDNVDPSDEENQTAVKLEGNILENYDIKKELRKDLAILRPIIHYNKTEHEDKNEVYNIDSKIKEPAASGDYTQNICSETDEVQENDELREVINIQNTHNEIDNVLNDDDKTQNPQNEIDECTKMLITQNTGNKTDELLDDNESEKTTITQDTCNEDKEVLNNDECHQILNTQNTCNEILSGDKSESSSSQSFEHHLFSEQGSMFSYQHNFAEKKGIAHESNTNEEKEIVDNILKKYTSRESNYPVPDENGNIKEFNLSETHSIAIWQNNQLKNKNLFDKMSETTGFLGSLSDTDSECGGLWRDRFLIGVQPEESDVAQKCNKEKESCDCYKTNCCLSVVHDDDEGKNEDVENINELVTEEELHSIETGSVSDWLYRVSPPVGLHWQPPAELAEDKSKRPAEIHERRLYTNNEVIFQDEEQLIKAFYIEQWLDNSEQYSTLPTYCGSGDFL